MVDFSKLAALARIKRLTPPQRFRYFVTARELAREAKETVGGPPPYTDDPIIAVNRFCNINREHDAVTRWVKVHVRDRLVELEQGPEQFVIQLLAARIWNHPPTLEKILPVIIPAVTLRRLAELRTTGEKVMRGAYMMPVHGSAGQGKSADEYYMNAVAEAQKVTWRDYRTLGEVARRLIELPGIGEFLANQVCADLRRTPYWAKASDTSTFVLCGPGTKRGLNRYAGMKPETGHTMHYFVEQLHQIRQALLDEQMHNTTFYDPNNVANCFCEWDKYERVLCGEVARLHSYP